MRTFFLAPISWIYGLVLSIRNRLYDSGIRKSIRYDIPVICVGNITVGGTGKTPMCELLISHFREKYNIALLSRGYGRKTKGYREVTLKSSYRNVGDEPKLIKMKYPDTVVVVCEDREEGIGRIHKEHPDVNLILMDDGFQHRRIEPRLNVLMVDYTRPIDKDRMLPLGTLRDKPEQVRRAHYVVVTKCPSNMTPLDRRIARKRLELLPFQCLFFTRLISSPLRPAFPDDAGDKPIPAGHSVIAMAAIGNPAPFIENIKSRYNLVDELLFRDHHPYHVRDLHKMKSALKKAPEDTIIITTEKDAVKLGSGTKIPPALRAMIYIQPIQTTFIEESKEDFFKKIEYDVRTNQADSFFYPR